MELNLVSIRSITYLCLFSRTTAISGLSGTRNLIINLSPRKERTRMVKKMVYRSLSITLLVKQMIPALTKMEIKEIISRMVYQMPIFLAPFGMGLRVAISNLYLSTWISAILFANPIR